MIQLSYWYLLIRSPKVRPLLEPLEMRLLRSERLGGYYMIRLQNCFVPASASLKWSTNENELKWSGQWILLSWMDDFVWINERIMICWRLSASLAGLPYHRENPPQNLHPSPFTKMQVCINMQPKKLNNKGFDPLKIDEKCISHQESSMNGNKISGYFTSYRKVGTPSCWFQKCFYQKMLGLRKFTGQPPKATPKWSW